MDLGADGAFGVLGSGGLFRVEAERPPLVVSLSAINHHSLVSRIDLVGAACVHRDGAPAKAIDDTPNWIANRSRRLLILSFVSSVFTIT